MNAKHYALSVAVMAATAASAATIGKVVVNQMWPWSTKVAIDYELTCDPGETWDVSLTVKDAQNNDVTGLSNAISGDTDNVSGGAHRLVWDPGRSLATGSAPVLSYTLSLSAPLGKKYMIVDLTRDGEGKFSVSYLDEEPSGGFNTDTYKTTKMVFRRCRAGSFIMGSPDDEPGHDYYSSSGELTDSEKQRKVTLTKDFYLSIFELTLSQTRIIWPYYYGYNSRHTSGRGKYALKEIYICHFRNATNATVSAVDWASSTSVDPTSLIGQFRAGIPGDRQSPATFLTFRPKRSGNTPAVQARRTSGTTTARGRQPIRMEATAITNWMKRPARMPIQSSGSWASTGMTTRKRPVISYGISRKTQLSVATSPTSGGFMICMVMLPNCAQMYG